MPQLCDAYLEIARDVPLHHAPEHDDELREVKNFMIGVFPLRFESTGGPRRRSRSPMPLGDLRWLQLDQLAALARVPAAGAIEPAISSASFEDFVRTTHPRLFGALLDAMAKSAAATDPKVEEQEPGRPEWLTPKPGRTSS